MNYIAIKMSTGAEVVGTLVSQDESSLCVIYPLQIVEHVWFDPEDSEVKRKTQLEVYFPYHEDRIFVMNKSHIAHAGPLKTSLVTAYKTLVEIYEKKQIEQDAAEKLAQVQLAVGINQPPIDKQPESVVVDGSNTLN